MPAEAPKREGRKFFGWAKNPTSEDSDFDEDTIVNNDTTVYATWNDSKIPLNSTGNVKAKIGNDGNIIISVKRPKRDRNIEREKWEDMVKELGGKVQPLLRHPPGEPARRREPLHSAPPVSCRRKGIPESTGTSPRGRSGASRRRGR